MYVDNELTAAERTEVEQFIAQNPDMQQELNMLQQAVLGDEPGINFSNPEILFKSEPGITLENYEEYFLLYVDGELTPSQAGDVERFVLQHPRLQEAFTLLRSTRLEAEQIFFNDKSSLYRYEKTERRIVPIRFLQFASAAAVLGFAFMVWLNTREVDKIEGRAVAVAPSAPAKAATPQTTVQLPSKNNTVAIAVPDNGSEKLAAARGKKAVNVSPSSNILVAKPNKVQPGITEDYENIALASNDRPEIKQMDNRNNLPERGVIQPLTENKNTALLAKNVENTMPVHQAVYRETDTETEEDERTLLIGGAEINKTKLRGLFKKAATFLDRRLKRDDKDYTVQVANFEIKTN